METLRELSRWKATLPKTRFQKKEQEAGWNLNQNGLLLSGLQIGAASSIMFDWMHVYVASGIWQLEVMQLLTELQRVGITQAMLHRELQAWHWPERISSRSVSGQKIFAKKQEGDSVKCSASEALSVYTVLRCILIRFLRSGQCRGIEDHIDSFVKICRVLDLLQSLKRNPSNEGTQRRAHCTKLWLDTWRHIKKLMAQSAGCPSTTIHFILQGSTVFTKPCVRVGRMRDAIVK